MEPDRGGYGKEGSLDSAARALGAKGRCLLSHGKGDRKEKFDSKAKMDFDEVLLTT